MIAQHFGRYFIFRMAFMIAMIALGLGEVRVSIAGFIPPPRSCPSDSPPGVIHALLIGVSQYQKIRLIGPANDLALLSQTLVNKGVKPENIMLLIDNQATVDGILTAIDKLKEKTQCGDQVIIHFSGMVSQFGLHAFVREGLEGLEEEQIRVITGDMLKDSLEKYPIPTFIFIDGCNGDFLRLPAMISSPYSIKKFAIIYPMGNAIETELPTLDVGRGEKKPYGLFSWCLAQSLTESSGVISDLAATVNRCLITLNKGTISSPLSFHATDWDMRLNFPSAPSAQSSDPDIEFVNLPPEKL